MAAPEEDIVACLDALVSNNDLSQDEKKKATEIKARAVAGTMSAQDVHWVGEITTREYEKALAYDEHQRRLDDEDFPDGPPH